MARKGWKVRRFEEKVRAEVAALAGVGDSLGKGLDEGIVELVAVLRVLGFETSGSCEGHVGWGTPGPWVQVGAGGKSARYQGEAAARRRILAEMGVEEALVKPGRRHDPAVHADFNMRFYGWVRDNDVPETAAYRAWQQRGHEMALALRKLVRAFEGADAGEPFLEVRGWYGGARLEVSDREVLRDEYLNGKKRRTVAENEGLRRRLARRQRLMRRFCVFLRARGGRA